MEEQFKPEYKREINWYLFDHLKKQYSTILDEDALKEIYLFEITEFEYMVIWAYKTDQAHIRLQTISNKIYSNITDSGKFFWIEIWKTATNEFKYIEDYLKHLQDVKHNCSIYWDPKQKKFRPFEYQSSKLLTFETDYYNRLTNNVPDEQSVNKRQHKREFVEV
jgi:hypothetical protein